MQSLSLSRNTVEVYRQRTSETICRPVYFEMTLNSFFFFFFYGFARIRHQTCHHHGSRMSGFVMGQS